MANEPAFHLIERREFFRRGLCGSAALALAATAPAGCAGYENFAAADETAELAFFSVKEYAVMSAAADALLPQGNGYPSHRELGIVRLLDREFAQWEPVRSKDIRLVLNLVEHGTLPFALTFSRFTRMDRKAQRDYLLSWGESGLNFRRAVFLALKGLLAFYYFADPRVWEQLGYDGPWLGRFDIPITPVDGLPA